jgi:hypothetical protein
MPRECVLEWDRIARAQGAAQQTPSHGRGGAQLAGSLQLCSQPNGAPAATQTQGRARRRDRVVHRAHRTDARPGAHRVDPSDAPPPPTYHRRHAHTPGRTCMMYVACSVA